MGEQIIYIKLFDEKVANALAESGFLYTKETINKDCTAYCFEKTSELLDMINNLNSQWNYEEGIVAVEDSVLHF